MFTQTMTVLERFESKFIPEPNSGCWLWLGSYTATGYGLFFFPPRNMVSAHTAAWELYKGSRNNMHVLHSCDIRCCVNPDHLRLGTHQDNMRERDEKGRQYDRNGARNGRAKLTEIDVLAIRADARWQRFVAADYNISVSAVQNIRRGLTWKHIK